MSDKKKIKYLEIGVRLAGVMASREQIEYIHAFVERMVETDGVFNLNEHINEEYRDTAPNAINELKIMFNNQ